MLYRVEIENFYSIRERQVIDLRAAANVPEDPERLAPAWNGSEERVPKVVAIFGPNASGKSNVLRALSFVAWFAGESFFLPPGRRIPFQPFSDAECRSLPTRFLLEFGGAEEIDRIGDPEARQCRYSYQLEIGGEDGNQVLLEKLSYWPSKALKATQLFSRSSAGVTRSAKAFGLSGYTQAIEKILRPNASLISTLNQLQHPFASALSRSLKFVISNIFIDRLEASDEQLVKHYAQNPTLVEAFNREIQRVDLGIKSLRLQDSRDGVVALFKHVGLDNEMAMSSESHGTRQFMKLFPLLKLVLDNGGVAVLDELDAAIHPIILPEIVRWFHDGRRNPNDAQLWMSCHNASLLEDLTKEEVFFTEKDRRGRTTIFGLADVAGVRRTENFYRRYLGGVYGAVPNVG